MEIRHIEIDNFAGIKRLSADLHHRTLIHGDTGTGKTSVKNAILWALTNKLSDGESPAGMIRPVDEDSITQRGDVSVELTMESADGTEMTLRKCQLERVSRITGEITGHETVYYLNGEKATTDEVERRLRRIASPNVWLYGMNAKALLKLSTKDRRKALLDILQLKPEVIELPHLDFDSEITLEDAVAWHRQELRDVQLKITSTITVLDALHTLREQFVHYPAVAEKINEKIKQKESEHEFYAAAALAFEKRIEKIEKSIAEGETRNITALNEKFFGISWRFEKALANGEVKSCCDPLVHGVSYYDLLNRGAKAFVETDICQAVQALADEPLPVIVDDAESLDLQDFKAAFVDEERQYIFLRRDYFDFEIRELEI